MKEPFYKLFNSGTSDGVKKAWDTRKLGSTSFEGDAKKVFGQHFRGYSKSENVNGVFHKFKTSPEISRSAAAKIFREHLTKNGIVPKEKMSKTSAGSDYHMFQASGTIGTHAPGGIFSNWDNPHYFTFKHS